MRVVVLHNAVAPDAPPSERDVLTQVEAVCEALEHCGHRPATVAVSLDLEQARQQLDQLGPDVVFNLVESLGGSDRLMYLVTSLLDVLGVAYTGAPTEALFALCGKLAAKRRMLLAGLPTPDWVTAERIPMPAAGDHRRSPGPPSPARHIIKPIYEHASFGIDGASIVQSDDPEGVRRGIAQRQEALGVPCFAERYVAGREFNLSLLARGDAVEVLPPAEIDFQAFPAAATRIVDYRAKWVDGSFEYENTPRRFPRSASDRPLLAKLGELARSCWHLFGLGGYARVDFRVDREGRPWILEVNANPCLSPDAGFAAALAEQGLAFHEAVARILDDAMRRRSGCNETGEATWLPEPGRDCPTRG